jgi:hypothetical protein
LALLGGDSIDLVGWFPFSKNRIEIKRGSDRLSGVCSIARHHDDPRDSGRSERLYGAWRLASKLVSEQYCADCASTYGDEHAQRGAPSRTSQGPSRPGVRFASPMDHLIRAHSNSLSVNHTFQTRAHGLPDFGWNSELEPFPDGRFDDRRSDNMM